ncbi:MAG: D-alanyl-D-alanine carboxypeptidase [Clostridiales bacterium]|jgi:D-alanyl-D-alanine carboxypeptidase (penicillin-binding protein 5/6)|nr:D-alanyl-D-alanine carboxypeptidase [Clostridiales bacterium]
MEQGGKKFVFGDFFKERKGKGLTAVTAARRFLGRAAAFAIASVFFAAVVLSFGGLEAPEKRGVAAAYAAGGSSYIAMEQTTNRTLYQSNASARLPMASTTKIMTAIVAIEKNDISKKVKIPRAAVGIEGSSIYLKENEELTMKDLLYGLMLMSGNDSAAAIAILTAGSIEGFAEMMNKKAEELGARNSHFVNPHGLHDAKHYTTAYDLALITCYALSNPVFQAVVSSERYIISDTGSGAGARYLYNKNKMLRMYDGADGVKTGYTKLSGRCLVSSAKRNGMRVVVVVLNHSDMWNDSISLLNRSFENYKLTRVLGEEQAATAAVDDGTKNSVRAVPPERYYPIRADERLSYEYSLKKVKAPVKKGSEIGKIAFSIDNRLIFEEKMYTLEGVKEKSILDHFKELF